MKGLIIALQFMTRIPLPFSVDVSEEDFGSSNKFFLLVGLIVGCFLAFLYYLLNPILPSLTLAAVLLIAEILITGGLLLDGFMDTMDGLLSARPREQALEIMRDSRVGAHSVTALFCLLLAKFSILASLSPEVMIYVLLVMPVMSRWLMLFTLAFYPYARKEGLGKIFWMRTNKSSWYLNTVLFIIALVAFFTKEFIISVLITFVLMLFILNHISNKLGGHTGDTYGAITEISELIFLFIFILIF